MSKKEYKFIKPLTQRPILKTKTGKKSMSQKIIEEFLESGVKYAEVSPIAGKEATGLMIGLGRYISKHELKDKVEVRRNTREKVVLLKK